MCPVTFRREQSRREVPPLRLALVDWSDRAWRSNASSTNSSCSLAFHLHQLASGNRDSCAVRAGMIAVVRKCIAQAGIFRRKVHH
jgi:hypothetical protein